MEKKLSNYIFYGHDIHFKNILCHIIIIYLTNRSYGHNLSKSFEQNTIIYLLCHSNNKRIKC